MASRIDPIQMAMMIIRSEKTPINAPKASTMAMKLMDPHRRILP